MRKIENLILRAFRITKEQDAKLKAKARELGVPAAEVLRRLLDTI